MLRWHSNFKIKHIFCKDLCAFSVDTTSFGLTSLLRSTRSPRTPKGQTSNRTKWNTCEKIRTSKSAYENFKTFTISAGNKSFSIRISASIAKSQRRKWNSSMMLSWGSSPSMRCCCKMILQISRSTWTVNHLGNLNQHCKSMISYHIISF